MSRRPSVERMIKRLKCDLGDDRLSKRGNESFQAYLTSLRNPLTNWIVS